MAGYFYIGGKKMDLLIEKDGKRTYLSRYKVITTSFEESSPSVKRNNTQIQYRNGNVDFGGWNESKTIDYVGYYRADDLEDEEYLRERIYALLSDPDGYYVTQLKNDNDNSFERPGETSGDYFDKQVNRPSHKRFYVYASSLESELVGSYGGHVLYKISAKFTTMKLPYGESVPRDLDVKPNVPYYGDNLALNTSTPISIQGNSSAWQNVRKLNLSQNPAGLTVTFSCAVTIDRVDSGSMYMQFGTKFNPAWGMPINAQFKNMQAGVKTNIKQTVVFPTFIGDGNFNDYMNIGVAHSSALVKFEDLKVEIGSKNTPWSPAPEDSEYSEWYLNTYYSADSLVIPYSGTVPCNQLEQGFAIEFTAKEAGSKLVIDVNGTELIYSRQVYSGDVIKLSGYEYTKNDISIIKYTNKAYFKLIPGITNTISSNLHGSIRILDYQDLYA
ncbi:hypothetical protein phiJL1_ORF441 [Lactobacillus phage phiJL-1]|uniref:Minor tail protein n=1 Tax=Lactobacillus phage phiJL-1 TaxID=2892345 RepID=Q597U5_9CAUD|nr:hypothetical protein phiJL1_ORF441 [Lactobacillus phage phiJL-1]AAP74526.1 minor tail protein [Lactobacillus phage phiJL-1]